MAIIRNANREWSYLFLMTSFARDPLWLLWNEGNFDTDLLYNSCLNSLQAKKWCSSLSSLHIDEELASLMPPKNWFRPFSPSSMQLSKLSWQSSSSTHANYQLPEETISPDPHQPSFNETFFVPFCSFQIIWLLLLQSMQHDIFFTFLGVNHLCSCNGKLYK